MGGSDLWHFNSDYETVVHAFKTIPAKISQFKYLITESSSLERPIDIVNNVFTARK